MRKNSSIVAILLLALYSITLTHSMVMHQHEEGMASNSHKELHAYHSYDTEHAHSHHGHSHQDKKPAKHNFWELLDHIFSAHSSASADLPSIYFSAKGQDLLEIADIQTDAIRRVHYSFNKPLAENTRDRKLTSYRHSQYTFLLYHSITLRGPPALV